MSSSTPSTEAQAPATGLPPPALPEHVPFTDGPAFAPPVEPGAAETSSARLEALKESCRAHERIQDEAEMDPMRLAHTLANQVPRLDKIFQRLVDVGIAAQLSGNEPMFERYIRLALRAQAQTTRTAQMLARLYEDLQPKAGRPAPPSKTPTKEPQPPKPAPYMPVALPQKFGMVASHPMGGSDPIEDFIKSRSMGGKSR